MLKIMNPRENVFKVINDEREFQNSMQKDPAIKNVIDLQLGSILSAIKYNVDKATNVWYYDSESYHDTMDILRKIAALCVQAGEKYGMPERVHEPYMPQVKIQK